VGREPGQLLARLLGDSRRAAAVTHVEERAERSGTTAPWPGWADALLVERLMAAGIDRPWCHQVIAADLAHAGSHVVVATGTASGKSLTYLLPVLSVLRADPTARALYLSPTKALAVDQLRAINTLGLDGVRAATYDGDTPREQRDWVRAHGTLVLTNPDMLHHGILPQHARFRALFHGLRYVVIDECHAYRGVFGSHVAQVLRRLRRVCDLYGAHPTFVLASATVANPAVSAGRLVGLPIAAVTEDTAPHGPVSFALYEPPFSPIMGEHGAPVRRSSTAEAGDLLADLVLEDARSLAFVRSRRGAELIAAAARRALSSVDPQLVKQVAAYRSGYLTEERRLLEAGLQSGALRGVAATSALELGLDVAGLDAVLVVGFPGTLASVWQQAGRAGRAGQAALVVFVARDDPLDSYLVHHPEALFGRPVEETVLDPTNPYVLAPQLECAAAELPLTESDVSLFEGAGPVLADLVERGRLRRRAGGWFWARHGERPEANLRGGGSVVALIEEATGRLLGTVDEFAAHRTVHTGAVYLHQGESYVTSELDLDAGLALLAAADPDWTTSARELTDIHLIRRLASSSGRDVELAFAEVDVTTQVVGYLRTSVTTGAVLDEIPLNLPARQLVTRAVLYAVEDPLLQRSRLSGSEVPGAAHAAEHAAIGLLPLFATCDRWDIGGVSTALHPDTGRATVFVFDGHPGGAGFAERGHARAAAWLAATRDAVAACECPTGCPSCVQSPKCGNGNEPLDKAGAVRLLTEVVNGLPTALG
jgi:DEAD/DEAH box helicase domain-containing protein